MTPPTAMLTRPAPVPVTISTRPPAAAVGALPVPVLVTPIGDQEVQFISDIETLAEAAGCSCSAGDDQPY